MRSLHPQRVSSRIVMGCGGASRNSGSTNQSDDVTDEILRAQGWCRISARKTTRERWTQTATAPPEGGRLHDVYSSVWTGCPADRSPDACILPKPLRKRPTPVCRGRGLGSSAAVASVISRAYSAVTGILSPKGCRNSPIPTRSGKHASVSEGGGRKPSHERIPGLDAAFLQVLADHTAGSPMRATSSGPISRTKRLLTAWPKTMVSRSVSRSSSGCWGNMILCAAKRRSVSGRASVRTAMRSLPRSPGSRRSTPHVALRS